MQIQELISYIHSLVNGTYYPHSFPTTAADDVAIITIQAGAPMDTDTGVSYPAFQILVRAKPRDFQDGETRAYELWNTIKRNLKEQQIGGHSVVEIRPQGSAPLFIGMDENERPIYSLNYNMVVRP